MKEKSDIGLVGIAVMGENLALNIESQGYRVIVSSRKQTVIDNFLNGRAKSKNIRGTTDLKTLVEDIKKPRKIILMIKAGNPVDQVIAQLVPWLDQGDIIIDGGNSLYLDTNRRLKELEKRGFLYVGAGISGGEEGALKGPSIMPGGSEEAWQFIRPIFEAIAAKVNGNEVCTDWMGPEGAGHFVKMVHNGIEYGDMQLISEIYAILRLILNQSPLQLSTIFKQWNTTDLKSYLIEITSDILAFTDQDGLPLIDKILDTAGQKGTGKWTVNASLDLPTPLTLISESVYARIISSLKDQRNAASSHYPPLKSVSIKDPDSFVEDARKALYLAKLLSYTQGFDLLKHASNEFNWKLKLGNIALIWRGGCIIRSAFLDRIYEAYEKNPQLENLILDGYFKKKVNASINSLRKILVIAIQSGIPTPALSAALNYFDSYRSAQLPANLLQAQRDYFGAHTYERIDQPRGHFFHTDWTGRGGKTSSSSYNR